MISHFGWGGERNTLIILKARENLSLAYAFESLEGKPGRESPKRTISTSGGYEPLQMVSKSDTGRCASKKVVP